MGATTVVIKPSGVMLTIVIITIVVAIIADTIAIDIRASEAKIIAIGLINSAKVICLHPRYFIISKYLRTKDFTAFQSHYSKKMG